MTVEENLLGQRSEKVHKGVKNKPLTQILVISEKKDNFLYQIWLVILCILSI